MSCYPSELNFASALLEADKMTSTTGRRRGVHFNTRSLTRALGSLYERTAEERKRKCSFQDPNPTDFKWLQLDDEAPIVPEVQEASVLEEEGTTEGGIEDMEVSEESDEKENNNASSSQEDRKCIKACKVKDRVHWSQGVVLPRQVVPIPQVSPPSSEEDDDWSW